MNKWVAVPVYANDYCEQCLNRVRNTALFSTCTDCRNDYSERRAEYCEKKCVSDAKYLFFYGVINPPINFIRDEGGNDILANDVNHQAYYEANTSIECVEAMMVTFGEHAVCHFCVCNAFKYIWRYKNKNGLEDLEKAQWYIDKAFEINEMYDTLSSEEQEALLRLAELKKQKEESWRESH